MRDRAGNLMTEEQIAGQVHEIRYLRDQYFPNSFIYEGREIADEVKPWYRVTVNSQAELELARDIQPSNVRAEFVLAPESTK